MCRIILQTTDIQFKAASSAKISQFTLTDRHVSREIQLQSRVRDETYKGMLTHLLNTLSLN